MENNIVEMGSKVAIGATEGIIGERRLWNRGSDPGR